MRDIEVAKRELDAGRVVVVPTDTVYGLAAVPSNENAIRALFELKGRPPEKALPILGADLDSLGSVAELDAAARLLVGHYWPGPLTLVVPRARGFETDLGGDDDGTVAVRVPASKVTRALLAASGPLAVTSANRSGEPPANSASEAKQVFGDKVACYLDDGPGGGTASTVMSLVGEPRVLREGAVMGEEIFRVLRS